MARDRTRGATPVETAPSGRGETALRYEGRIACWGETALRYEGSIACWRAMSSAASREEGPAVAAPIVRIVPAPIVRIVPARGDRPCRPRRFPHRPALPALARGPRPPLPRSGVRCALPHGWSTGRSARPRRPGDHHAVRRRPLRPAGRRRGARPPALDIAPRPGADRARLRPAAPPLSSRSSGGA